MLRRRSKSFSVVPYVVTLQEKYSLVENRFAQDSLVKA